MGFDIPKLNLVLSPEQLAHSDASLPAEDDKIKAVVKELPLSELHPFRDHPFQVVDNEEMQELLASILERGVLNPVLVRPDPSGGYEIISGHRRARACQLAEKTTIPAIILHLDDDDAIILMVDCNLQRTVQISERAKACRMKLDAMKRKAGRPQKNVSQVGTQKRSDQELAEQLGISRNQVQRYVRLSYLCEDLLNLVDAKTLPFNVGVEISYLTPDHQKTLLQMMKEKGVPNLKKAGRLKELEQSGSLDAMAITDVLSGKTRERKTEKQTRTIVSLPLAEISGFLPSDTQDVKKAITHKLQWQRELFTKYFPGLTDAEAENQISLILENKI